MIELSELHDAAQKAFPADKLSPDRNASWSLVAEMGWLMLRIPEDEGGLGLGREASSAIHFEMGRVLSRAPLIPAELGLHAVLASDGLVDRAGWIERIAGGDYMPLNMLPGEIAEDDGAFFGTLHGFLEADMASHLVAALPGCYALVPVDAPGVSLVERQVWDPSRRVFDLRLDGFRPELVLAEGDAAVAMHDVIAPEAHIALAADSLGGANGALALTVEYLAMRKQFDRPIGMFQALKHRVADLKTRIVADEALLWSRAAQSPGDMVGIGTLKALACEDYALVTEEMIQLHGGIGLTNEHQCHLFMKRAMLNGRLCGSADVLLERAGRTALAMSCAGSA